MTKVDAVAEAFALRVDDITAKHRMLGMQLHATQARIHFLEQDKVAKQRDVAQADEKAALLQTQLTIANETLHRLKREISHEVMLASRARSDEPRLLAACRSALAEAESRHGRWESAGQRLTELEHKWSLAADSAFLRPYTTQIASLDDELRAASEAETSLHAQLEALRTEAAARSVSMAAPRSPTANLVTKDASPAFGGDSGARRRLEDELAVEKRRIDDETSMLARNLAAMQAEITELNSKAVSLDQWIEETRTAHDAIVAAAAAADRALQTGCCPRCCGGEGH